MARAISNERIGELMQGVLRELAALGGRARARDLFPRAAPKLGLTDYERGVYEKSGGVRWQNVMYFYSIDCQKAGFLQKSGGQWLLTPEGERALQLRPGEFKRTITERYRSWKAARADADRHEAAEAAEAPDNESEPVVRQITYEQARDQAQAGIAAHIRSLSPYEFQDLVAALLTAMGYHIPFVAPPGRDGGVDVIAYKDPLGTMEPRIRVQVKHRDSKVTNREVREMEGLLRRDGDMGLIVASGGFTSEVEREIRASTKHIETMDMERLISLWQQNYDHVPESARKLLPLTRLYFLAPLDE